MKLEEPCSPGHCLGMLNANMRTDMLRSVHQGIAERKEQPHQKSPLEMLIESIEQTLVSFEGGEHLAAIGPNPNGEFGWGDVDWQRVDDQGSTTDGTS